MPLHMSARPADKTVKFSITTHIALPSPILNVVDAGGSAYGNTPNEARRRR